MSKLLTIVISYYEQPEFLCNHYIINDFLIKYHKYFDIVIVDDNSVKYPLKDTDCLHDNVIRYKNSDPTARCFHSHTLRNRAIEKIDTPWLLFLDLDTIFDPSDLKMIIRNIVEGLLTKDHFYMFDTYFARKYAIEPELSMLIVDEPELIDRSDNNGPGMFVRNYKHYFFKLPPQCHPNVFLMHRECYDTTGGYSELMEKMREGDYLFFTSIDHDRFPLKILSTPCYITISNDETIGVFNRKPFEKIQAAVLDEVRTGNLYNRYKTNIDIIPL